MEDGFGMAPLPTVRGTLCNVHSIACTLAQRHNNNGRIIIERMAEEVKKKSLTTIAQKGSEYITCLYSVLHIVRSKK